MDFTTILVVLGLIGTVWSFPITDLTCNSNCIVVNNTKSNKPQLLFKHVLDFQNTSVAPWILENHTEDGREPRSIQFAKCMECSEGGMVAKPIEIMIYVYKQGTGDSWYKCPCRIAVGCTCVRTQQVASS